MRKPCLVLAAALLACAAFSDGDLKILFTEREFEAGGGRVALTNTSGPIYRATVDYVAEKPLALVVRPPHNAFMGLWRHTLPAAPEPRRETCDFTVWALSSDAEFRIEGGGARQIRKLAVETISDKEYRPSTTIPNPARKNNARHAKIKRDYAAAPPHPVVLFGDSLTDNWRGARFAYMTTNFPVVNAGICGDRIEHLLWRIEDMRDLLTNNPPSVATLLIGTNNFGLDSGYTDIGRGILNLVTTLRTICPETRIVVFGIPPRALSWRKAALPFPQAENGFLASYLGSRDLGGRFFFFDFSPLLLENGGTYLCGYDGGDIRTEFYERDALHFSDRGYADVVTPFVAGAIRLAIAKNLPPDYMKRMWQWAEYLRRRRQGTGINFALEEMLACEAHLAALPGHWMKVFSKLEADPDYAPEMPDEYLRQEREEGLPDLSGF